MEHYKVNRNEIVAGDVNPNYINPRQVKTHLGENK
jgi:adenylylsulfate reductase subunit A